jgi:hypothetical protein
MVIFARSDRRSIKYRLRSSLRVEDNCKRSNASKNVKIFILKHFQNEITKQSQDYIKPPYLEVLIFLHKKLTLMLTLLCNVIILCFFHIIFNNLQSYDGLC